MTGCIHHTNMLDTVIARVGVVELRLFMSWWVFTPARAVGGQAKVDLGGQALRGLEQLQRIRVRRSARRSNGC